MAIAQKEATADAALVIRQDGQKHLQRGPLEWNDDHQVFGVSIWGFSGASVFGDFRLQWYSGDWGVNQVRMRREMEGKNKREKGKK